MTSTPTETIPSPVDPESPTSTQPKPRRRALIISAAVAAVLALGGAATAVVATNDHNAWVEKTEAYSTDVTDAQAQVETSAQDIAAEHSGGVTALTEQITAGEAVLAGTDQQVADNQVRVDLRAALDAAIALRDATPAFTTDELVIAGLERDSIFAEGSRPEQVFTITTASTPSLEELTSAGTAVETASAAVSSAQAQWAYDQLNAAIVNARDVVLPASDQKVLDNQVRVDLQASIDAALPTSDAGVGATDVATLLAQRDDLNLKAQAVVDAQAAWQTEQDRIAAEALAQAERERAAAAAQAAKPATSSGSGSSSTTTTRKPSTGSTGSGSSGSTGGGGNTTVPVTPPATNNPAPPANSGTPADTSNGTDLKWCKKADGSWGALRADGTCR